ncbi:MAG: C1 family peptidase [Bryobacteraceae bacterium]|jgi:C1A family cysteine protease
MKHFYGWRPDTPDQRDFLYRAIPSLPVPADLDLRPEQPPIFDQGQLGSCTGNGIAGELEAQALMQGEPMSTLSRLFIYYNERAMEGTVSEDAGAEIRDGIKSVATQGVCPESAWPYKIGKFAVKPPKQCYTDALKFRALRYRSVPQTLATIKSALSTARGIVFGISVYESFESDEVAKTGIVPLPGQNEQVLGGHCVRLVGFTDHGYPDIPAGHFIGMNSWGVGWGLKGFFAIPYGYVTNPNFADDLWVINAVS